MTVTAPNASTRAIANNQTELVLQVNQGINWAIDKIKVKAGEALDSELARYEAGLDLMVGGITVNKAMFGDAVHITEDIIIDKNSPYKNGAIFFVEEGKTIEIVTTWEYSFNYLVVIGNSGTQTARFKVAEGADMSYLNSNGEKERNGYFLWKNVTFDNNGGKVFYCNSESPDVNNPEHPYNFVFDDCKIEFWGTIFSFWDKNNIYFENFKIQDCTFVMNAGGQQMIDGNSGNSNNFGNVVLANNLFYSPKNTITHKLINGKGLAPNKIALSNNTFVNVAPGSNDAFIRVSKVLSHFTCTDNIFYTDGALDGANVVFFPENYESLDGRLEGSFKNNIGYRASGAGKWDAVWYGMKPVADFQPIMSLEGVANSPFEVCNIKDVILLPKMNIKSMVYNVNTNRENMKKILFLFFGLFFMITWQSCDERDDIRKDIDELNARLDGIQPLIIQLNKDIVSYKALLDGSLWIVDFTVNSCGDYTIRFNDGSDMTVYSGETDEEIPQVAIGEDGIWYYTQNGEKYPLLGSDGNPAPVFGENGVTPQIRINNKTGRWEYSLDQGTTWQGDLGAALPRNGISVFDDVAYSKNEDGGNSLFSDGIPETYNMKRKSVCSPD